jgi:hypothetical protein
VSARDVAYGGDDDHERQPEGERHGERVVDAGACGGALQDRRDGYGAARVY